jgi:hypothetical protein
LTKLTQLLFKTNFFLLLFLSSIGVLEAGAVDVSLVKDKKILDQINRDGTLIPMGKGSLFVPYLADLNREPSYTIYKNSKFVKNASPGRRTALNPGKYTLFIGSGPLNIREKIEAVINEERVTVVIPSWSALTVTILDTNNNQIREGYQIANEETKLYIASGVGADDLKGEKQQIWILKPGLYRVMKKGESADSFKNYITVRTRAGFPTNVSLIFDEKLRELVGGGETSGHREGGAQQGNWNFKAMLAGNFSFINDGYVGSENKSSIVFGASLNGSIIFELDKYLFINKLEIYEQFQKSDIPVLEFTRDSAKFDSSFIYRINKYMGPYISLRARTSFFNRYEEIADNQNVTVEERDGTSTVISPGTWFQTGYPFSPLIVQEGVGMNFEYRHGTIFSIDTRLGWGVRQDIASKMYDTSNIEEGTIERVKSFNNTFGPEFSLHFTLSPLSFFEIREEFETLIPVENSKMWSYISKTTLSLWISSFASIQYEFDIERNPSTSDSSKELHSLTLQLFYKLL